MSVDHSAGMDVNENSNLATINAAQLINGATQTEANVSESVAQNELKTSQAEEIESARSENAGSSLSARAGATASNLGGGGNRAAVYGDVAMEAAGMGAVSQMASLLKNVVTDKTHQIQHNSLDDLLDGKVSTKPSQTAGNSIRTKHFNDLSARREGISNFITKDGVKGVKMSEQKSAEYAKKCEISLTAKMVCAEKHAVSKAMEAKVGAKVAKAQTMGLGSQLVHNRMGKGPQYIPPKEADEVIEDKETWMS